MLRHRALSVPRSRTWSAQSPRAGSTSHGQYLAQRFASRAQRPLLWTKNSSAETGRLGGRGSEISPGARDFCFVWKAAVRMAEAAMRGDQFAQATSFVAPGGRQR